MNVHNLILSMFFLLPLGLQPTSTVNDVSDWYHEYQWQSVPANTITKRVATISTAALLGSWAAQAVLQQPAIDDNDSLDFFEKIMNMRTEPVDWWQQIAPAMRGVLVGVLMYAVASWVYDGFGRRVRSLLPHGSDNRSFRSFIQQWPQHRANVEPLFHPFFDRLHDYVNEYGVAELPHLDHIRDGITCLGTLHEKRDISAYIKLCQTTSRRSRKKPLSRGFVEFVSGMTRTFDFLVPLIASVVTGQKIYLGLSLQKPLWTLGIYMALRYLCGMGMDALMQKEIHAHINEMVRAESVVPESLQNHLLQPLRKHYQQTGSLPTLSDKQARQIAAVLTASTHHVPQDRAFLAHFLATPDHSFFKRLARVMTTKLCALAVPPALLVAAMRGGGTRETAGAYAGLVMLFGAVRWWRDMQRSQDRRTERFSHFIQHWPRYKDRLPEEVDLIVGPMHMAGVTKLSPLAMDRLYEKLYTVCGATHHLQQLDQR